MGTHTRATVDDVDDLQHREHTVIRLRQQGQVRRRYREDVGHVAIPLAGRAVTYGAIIGIETCPDFLVLRMGN